MLGERELVKKKVMGRAVPSLQMKRTNKNSKTEARSGQPRKCVENKRN